uniref:Uncharacterized protein n=1 Tax=Romanomermis culicivorax TaxID=13658 RepID=A0A915ILY3_ROMCU
VLASRNKPFTSLYALIYIIYLVIQYYSQREGPKAQAPMLADIKRQEDLKGIPQTRTLPCKFAWIIFVIAVFVAGMVMCYTSIVQYAAYEVSTNLRIDTAPKPMTFPSVTFCVHEMFVTNSIYNSQPIIRSLVNVWEKNKGEKTRKSCQNAPEKIPAMSTSDIGKVGGFMAFINKITLTFPKHLLACWWREEQFPCNNRTFTQHPTDVGNCFTFNMADVWKTRQEIVYTVIPAVAPLVNHPSSIIWQPSTWKQQLDDTSNLIDAQHVDGKALRDAKIYPHLRVKVTRHFEHTLSMGQIQTCQILQSCCQDVGSTDAAVCHIPLIPDSVKIQRWMDYQIP